jgi:hypothetical protein
MHDSGGIRTGSVSKRAAADPRLRTRGHRDPCLSWSPKMPVFASGRRTQSTQYTLAVFLLFVRQVRRILLRAVKKRVHHTVLQRTTVSLTLCVMYDLRSLSLCTEFLQELLKFESN